VRVQYQINSPLVLESMVYGLLSESRVSHETAKVVISEVRASLGVGAAREGTHGDRLRRSTESAPPTPSAGATRVREFGTSQPEASNPKPRTPNPKPEAKNSKPQTPNHNPES